jgi:5-methylcytosine-specific restriction protein A
MARRGCLGPGCVAMVDKGFCAACAKKRSPEALRVRGVSKRWYDCARWKKRRAAHFKAHPLCADLYGVHGPLIEAATEFDHPKPHRGDYELFWNQQMQGLCKSCHSRKTATEDGGFGR